MGTEVRGVPEAAALAADSEADGSIGRYLARQRELRHISLDELSAQTKIPVRSLQRLESGAFDREPDGFARGFVRTVAEALGLDPGEAVMRLLREPPDDEVAAGPGRRASGRVPLGGALGVAALLVLALAAWALFALRGPGPEPGSEAPTRPAASAAARAGVVYRSDAVRSLVEDQARAQPAPPRELPTAAALEEPAAPPAADAAGP